MAKESEDSFKRLTNELLILSKLGQQALERDGTVSSDDFVMAGEAALESMRKFDQSGHRAPEYVLDFFVNFPISKIIYSGDPAEGSREVQNVQRLAEARRRR
jgi:hypothetical protein